MKEDEIDENPPPDPEWVPEDDAVIGVWLRRSLLTFAVLGAIALLAVRVGRRPPEETPEQEIETAAPEAVVEASAPPDVTFTDVTAAAGIGFVHQNGAYGDKLLPETMGGGVAFFDADGDGDQDLLFVNSSHWPEHDYGAPPPTMALYRNDGGRFTDVSRESGLDLSFYGMGVAVADYDADGRDDVFLTALGPNHLLRNLGGRFEDVTAAAGVAGDPGEWSTGAAFFDADGDGDLDLFVGNYVRWTREIDFELDYRLTGVGRAYGPPQTYQGTFPYLYRNDGAKIDGPRNDGPHVGGPVTFTDVSAASGVRVANPATGAPMAKTLGLAVVDVDRDGALDLLLANDTVGNFLLRNAGNGTFVEEAELFGLAYDRAGNATGAMGIDWGNYRNDDNLGFLIGNFANEMTSLYVAQDDPGSFADEAIGEGVGAPSRRMLSFGILLLDYDLDGRLDLLQANGHLEDEIAKVDPSQSYRQPAQLFWNAGLEGGFAAVDSAATGDLARPIVGRGSAYADIDGDGDLDVVLTQVAGPPLLLRNDQALGHHWLRLELVGRPPNLGALGARVEVTAGGVVQRREVMPTRSYLSQVERVLTFGLRDLERVDKVEVFWPDGSRELVEGLAVDRLHRLEQDG